MKNKSSIAYIGVGSNIQPEKNIYEAFIELCRIVTVSGISTFYRTRPLSERKQGDYLNGVIRIRTTLEPLNLKYTVLRGIEARQQRVRYHDIYAPRTLDLDILLFGDLVIDTPDIVIPDPDIYVRPFIAIPLYELDQYLILPDTCQPIASVARGMIADTIKPEKAFTEIIKRMVKE